MKVAYKVDNVPFYKHTEEFKLGQSVTMSRRDKKQGQQHAALRALPKGVEVDIQLDPPFSGIESQSLCICGRCCVWFRGSVRAGSVCMQLRCPHTVCLSHAAFLQGAFGRSTNCTLMIH